MTLPIKPLFTIFSTAFFSLLIAANAQAAKPWTGTVTSVVDGDTVWVRPDKGLGGAKGTSEDGVDIRIDGIDAPEICQTYGAESKAALQKLAYNQHVTVTVRRIDQYGRSLAAIKLGGDDIGDWMVRHGHAWSYHYRRDSGPYAAQEALATTAKRGLFADAARVAPRDFRKQHGTCHVKPIK